MMGDYQKTKLSSLMLLLLIMLAVFAVSCKKKENKPASESNIAVHLKERIEFSPSIRDKIHLKKERKKLGKVVKSKKMAKAKHEPVKNSIDVKLKPLSKKEKLAQKARASRDPFNSVLNELEEMALHHALAEALTDFSVKNYVLVGTLMGEGRARALVEDPSGIGYTLNIGDSIGRNGGRVYSISKNRITVKEFHKDTRGKKLSRYVIIELGQ